MITQKLLDLGYNAIVDVHGYNVADAPVIILNADKNLKRRKVLATYTAPVANEIRKGSLKYKKLTIQTYYKNINVNKEGLYGLRKETVECFL